MDASFWTYLRYLFELGLPLPSFMIPVFTGKPSGVCLCVCVRVFACFYPANSAHVPTIMEIRRVPKEALW